MPAEMQPLIEALNAMIAKLDAAALAHRSFIANAAHQLRTPLTALNLQAEQAIQCGNVDDDAAGGARLAGGGESRDAARQPAAAAVARGAGSAVGRQPHVAPISTISRSRPRARGCPAAVAASIDLGFDETSAHAVADVDAALVAEAINNLLDNALKYCPPHAKVTVSVRLLPEPTIVVEDTGPGIARAERSRVVQRFYRGDNATDDGTGLGLAIAHEVALAHAGQFVIARNRAAARASRSTFPPRRSAAGSRCGCAGDGSGRLLRGTPLRVFCGCSAAR